MTPAPVGRLRAWWARLRGKDERTVEAEKRLAEALHARVEVANDAVDRAVLRACIQAQRVANLTPPPRPRLAPIPSIPEDDS